MTLESSLPDGVQRRQFDDQSRLTTHGTTVYEEPRDPDGWRLWDAGRSKLGAMFELDIDTGLTGGDSILYLGAASGTTVSHVADFAGPTYAVEFAPRPARDLLEVARTRPNLIPLLCDARQPETYAHVVERNIDCLIQDVATRGQATVALRNRKFLAPDGHLILAIKARSENVLSDPEDVFDSVISTLREGYTIQTRQRLDRFHDDHLAVVATPRMDDV